MNKNAEDQPAQKNPTDAELERLAANKPAADRETKYQDDKGQGKDGVQQKENPQGSDDPKR